MTRINYKTHRNKELSCWTTIEEPLLSKYDKNDMIFKLEELILLHTNNRFWIDLLEWLNSGKKLTLRQVDSINRNYHNAKKRNDRQLIKKESRAYQLKRKLYQKLCFNF